MSSYIKGHLYEVYQHQKLESMAYVEKSRRVGNVFVSFITYKWTIDIVHETINYSRVSVQSHTYGPLISLSGRRYIDYIFLFK